MFGRVEGESRDIIWVDGVPDKAASRMRVESDHEEKGEMVGVPKRFKALAADLVMSGCVHYDHYEQHKMTSDATRLRVMNVLCALLTDLCIMD